jgi:hypothetical protein
MAENKLNIIVKIIVLVILIQVIYFAVILINPLSETKDLSPTYAIIYTVIVVGISILMLFVLIIGRVLWAQANWLYVFVFLGGMCIFAVLSPFISVNHKSFIHYNDSNIIDLIIGIINIILLVYLLIHIHTKQKITGQITGVK